jgi:hypothetical protein
MLYGDAFVLDIISFLRFSKAGTAVLCRYEESHSSPKPRSRPFEGAPAFSALTGFQSARLPIWKGRKPEPSSEKQMHHPDAASL